MANRTWDVVTQKYQLAYNVAKVRLGENMKILVTGGAGFIGHHLVTDLLQKQCQVNILDVVDISDNRVEYLVSLGANYFQGTLQIMKISLKQDEVTSCRSSCSSNIGP